MKKLIIEFNETGICEVDIDKIVKRRNDDFSIHQYHDEYTLVQQGRGKNYTKVTISQEQAKLLIDKLKLLPIQSVMLRFGKSFRTESKILSEKTRIQEIVDEKEKDIQELQRVISEFNEALAKKIN